MLRSRSWAARWPEQSQPPYANGGLHLKSQDIAVQPRAGGHWFDSFQGDKNPLLRRYGYDVRYRKARNLTDIFSDTERKKDRCLRSALRHAIKTYSAIV